MLGNPSSPMVEEGIAGRREPGGSVRPRTATERSPRSRGILPAAAIALAIAFGLCAGYLDLVIIVVKKLWWNPEGYYRTARDFPWSVPVGHAALMVIPGVDGRGRRAGSGRDSSRCARDRGCSRRWRSGRPCCGCPCTAVQPAPGRRAGSADQRRGRGHGDRHSRRLRCGSLAALLGVLVVLAVLSSGRQALREYRAVGGLPAAPPRARNVVLIVWDTVRAYNLSLYGYPRNTTPNLANGLEKGVRYHYAVAPAPWTYPSHSCFFTGQWPFKLNSQWNSRSTPRIPRWPSTWPRGAIRPPGSRRTPTAAVTRPGWIGASPITRITR